MAKKNLPWVEIPFLIFVVLGIISIIWTWDSRSEKSGISEKDVTRRKLISRLCPLAENDAYIIDATCIRHVNEALRKLERK